ncbi:6-phosphofructokinase [Candidatus Uabimicrobium sp. HlEnr_7]|uniref:6-phosphofructokinase n=1 Tax=Candidatus Uabimicrobium helgolandensis TaxID=3095367 RepID=UPI00355656F9
MAQELEFSQDDPQLKIFLRQSRIFKDICEDDLSTIISFIKKYEYEEGEVVFSQGGLDATIYIVATGRCAIEKSGRCINILNAGDIFGEVSMLGQQPHLATARALKSTTLYFLPADLLIEENISAQSLVKIYKELGSLVTSYIRGEDALYQEIDVLMIQDGGCSPGYNSVTSFVVQFLEHYQRSAFVAATGFKSLVEGGGASNLRCLIYNEKLYKQLEHIPGVIHAPVLREERGARFRCERYEGFRLLENQQKAAKNILQHKTRVIVGIGGNGTLEGLKALSKLLPRDLQMFFLPATIDSDIYGTECIGQHAGVEMGAEKVRCYMADARTHKRCYIIEMMGARGGHHALHSCLGAGAHLAVLPGFKYDIKKITDALKDRDYTVIVVAEGYKRDQRKSNNISGSAAEFFYQELLEEGLQTKQRVICEEFSRDIRGASPNNMDITLAQRLARNLTNLILQGKTYLMPAVLSGKEYALHLDEIQTDNSVSEELVVLANRLGDPGCITTNDETVN